MQFEKSDWAKSEYTKNYLEKADYIIPFRRTFYSVLVSFFERFVADGKKKIILDLGTGNGILTKTLFEKNKNIEFIVTDGSDMMLDKAKENLKGIPVKGFVNLTFQEIIEGKLNYGPFDFVMSSFAIHHLYLDEKKLLFEKIYDLLKTDGYFINIDTAINQKPEINNWYYQVWKEWITDVKNNLELEESYEDVPDKSPSSPENHYDPLDIQLDFLQNIGFKEVECHFKFGIFTLFGGKK